MIIYLDKNKKPNIVCDGDNVLTDILEGENIIIERDLAHKTITISSDAKSDTINSIKAGNNIKVEHSKDNKTITISSDSKKDIMDSIKAGDNITIDYDQDNKTVTINSNAKGEIINSIKAGDNIVIDKDSSGNVTISALVDILEKNPTNPKPGYMWILNSDTKNPSGDSGESGGNTGGENSGDSENNGENTYITKGNFAIFDEAGNFYYSNNKGVSWQKRGQMECDDGANPSFITPSNNILVASSINSLRYSTDNGYTWNYCTQPVYSCVRNIKNINGKFYACCGSSSFNQIEPAILLVSDDGITWKSLLKKYENSTFSFRSIKLINNMYFLFAKASEGGATTLLSSSNGTSWTECTCNSGACFPDVFYNGEYFIIFSDTSTGIEISSDGRTWSYMSGCSSPPGNATTHYITYILEANGKYYMEKCKKLYTSTDLLHWDYYADAANGEYYLPVYYNGIFYCFDYNGTFYSSTNLLDWNHVSAIPLTDSISISFFTVL